MRKAVSAAERVLIINSWPTFGGGERFVLDLVESLRERGSDVTVACASDELARRAGAGGATTRRLQRPIPQVSHLTFLLQLATLPILYASHLWLFLRLRPDVIHLVTFEEQQLCTPLYRALARRLTWSVHGIPPIRNRVQQWLYRAAGNRASQIVAVSGYVARDLERQRIASRQIVIVHHGVELPAAAALSRAAETRIGFVGRLEPVKDPALFLDVADRVRDCGVAFLMYGAGSLETEIRRAIRERNLNHVELVNVIYQHIDVILLTSCIEGLGYSLLEAGAYGLPCIVPDLPVVREVIVTGETGLICDRSADTLAGAVRRLAADRELRRSLGLQARTRIGSTFSKRAAQVALSRIVLGRGI
jgi:glycosyltransferase involved in cell wall biosynthesis